MAAKGKTRRGLGKTQRWKDTGAMHSKRPTCGCEKAVEYSDEFIEALLELDKGGGEKMTPDEFAKWLRKADTECRVGDDKGRQEVDKGR